MKILLTTLALAASVSPTELTTRSSTDAQLRLRWSTEIDSSTESTFELDGRTMDRERPGGGDSSVEQEVVWLDHVVEVTDGRPTQVRRTFETVRREVDGPRGSRTEEGPLQGSVLLLTTDAEGNWDVEQEEGVAEETLLAGHRGALFFESLLPGEGLEPGDTWDIDGDAIGTALGHDLRRALFPRSQEEGRGRRGEGRRRGARSARLDRRLGNFGSFAERAKDRARLRIGRRLRQGQGMRGGRGGFPGLLSRADWSGKGTWLVEPEEVDGELCHIVSLELEAELDLGEDALGRGQRDFAAGERTASPSRARARAGGLELDSTWTGRVAVSVETRRPVLFEIEGRVTTELEVERERDGGTLRIVRREEGTVSHTIGIEEVGS